MPDEDKRDTIDRMIDAYETMLERTNGLLDAVEEKGLPALRRAIDASREKAVELGELSREEADRVASYLQRDMQDAAHWITETGQEFRDWFRFDWQLIEDRLFEMFANVADQTSVQLREWAERAREVSGYRTGEITGPGTLLCSGCGKELHFERTGHIPPCPACAGTQFRRPNLDEAVSEGVDQGDVDGD